jgi:hypothetical protein
MPTGPSPATDNKRHPLATSDHGLALVPLGTGYHQSPDVFALGRSVDTGQLAESLIYYDRVLITVDNPVRFSDLISLLVQQGLPAADIIELFRDGTLQVLNFAFTTNPYVEFRESGLHIHGLYNIQDQQMLKADSFGERFLGFEPLRSCFADNTQFDDFCSRCRLKFSQFSGKARSTSSPWDMSGETYACDFRSGNVYFGLMTITESMSPLPSASVDELFGSSSPTPSTRNL